MSTTPLTLYGTISAASAIATANKLAIAAGGSSATKDVKLGTTTPSGWGQLYSQGNASAWPNLGAMGDPDGHGWYLEVLSLVGQQINSGNWTPTIRLQIVGGGSPSLTANLVVNAYVYNSGIYTPIGSMELDTQSLTSSAANHVFSITFLDVTDFYSGDILYIECWTNITAASGVGTANSIRLSEATGPTTGVTNNFSIVTPGYQVQTDPVVGTIWPTLTIAKNVLQNILWNGWNELAAYKGKNTDITAQNGGLFINWQYNDPTISNVQGDGIDDQERFAISHDPLTCVRYLQCMAHYLQFAPTDEDIFDTPAFPFTNLSSWLFHIAQLDFGTFYTTPKGFVYFSLKQAGELFENRDLLISAQATANNFMRSYRSGYFWGFKSSGATYSVNSSAGCCSAVLDVALRYPNFVYSNPSTKLVQAASDFIAAAKSGMDHILAVCQDATTGLCFDNMNVSYDADGSHDTPVAIAHHSNEFNSRASTSTEVAEHLLRMYQILNNPTYASINPGFYDPTRAATYKAAAYQMLDSCYSFLWDIHQTGFFFAVIFTGTPPGPYTTSVTTAYKETRATSAAIRAYVQSVAIDSTYSSILATCVNSMSDDTKFLKTWGNWWGYVYRVNPDFSFYVTSPGQGVGLESQVTSEAMGSSVDALLQAYGATQFRPIVVDDVVSLRNGLVSAHGRNGKPAISARGGKCNAIGRNGKITGVSRPGIGGPP